MRSTRPAPPAGSVNVEELITALKRRINPEGVLDIPIRKIGNTGSRSSSPRPVAEEVEEVKRKMTNVGSLEFRILANQRTTAASSTGRSAPRTPDQPPLEVPVGQARRDHHRDQPHVRCPRHVDHRPVPAMDQERLRRPDRSTCRQERRRASSRPRSASRSKATRSARPQAPEAAQARGDHRVPDRVQPQPDHRREPPNPYPTDPIIREEQGRARPPSVTSCTRSTSRT